MVTFSLGVNYHCVGGGHCVQLQGRLHNPENHIMNIYYYQLLRLQQTRL
jgi:hypothetical protein